MAKLLTIDEMLEALIVLGHPQAGVLQHMIETLADHTAALLAERIGAAPGHATFEGSAFHGTCVAFYPTEACKEWPDEIGWLDESGDFEFGETLRTDGPREYPTAPVERN